MNRVTGHVSGARRILHPCDNPGSRLPASTVYQQLIPIIAPVAICALLGFGWARSGLPFEREFVTRTIMNIGAPALILDGIGGLEADSSQFVLAMALSVAVLVICALAGFAVLRLSGQPLRSHLPPVVFGNVGNLGLPLCLYAFGSEGLGLAVAFYLVGSLSNFIIVAPLMGRENPWRTLVRTPIIYAAVGGLMMLVFDYRPAPWLANTLDLVAGLAIPLMLLALGHALGRFRIASAVAAVRIALLRLGVGFAAGWLLTVLFQLDGVLRGVVLIQASMPVAIFNFLLAARYDRHPEDVAGSILLSTMTAFVLLPALLLFVLGG